MPRVRGPVAMITLQWKDPDTDVLHVIAAQGFKNEAEKARLTMAGGRVTQRFLRTVSMCCGMSFLVDSDDHIVPAAYATSAILRPWLTTRDAPTCVACIAAPPPFTNEWNGTIRGA